MHRKYRFQHHRSGFTLTEIMIVVAIIGIIVAIAVPGFFNARIQSQAKSCQENQSALASGVQEWALANNKEAPPSLEELTGSGNYLSRTPTCPATGKAIPMPIDLDGKTVCPTGEPGHEIVP